MVTCLSKHRQSIIIKNYSEKSLCFNVHQKNLRYLEKLLELDRKNSELKNFQPKNIFFT